ncbi:MAG: T9SS type A sorting domain-containing protein [Ignavibacteria bacterium]|nr:T9SS type A sorting domain-containing protein [Ignavibacteria bacterium]
MLLFILTGTNTYADNNNQFNNPIDDKLALQQSDDYKLFQNYPNPFNPTTKISYKINKEGFVSLMVYNLVGQVVGVLVEEQQISGSYEVEFDASQLTTGVYLYKLQVNGYTSVKRMTVLK